jgi:REP element-mobilizing transposase RayT
MENNSKLPIRKKNRLQHYDYSSCGAYFITVCTDKRQPTLSRIVGDDVLGVPFPTKDISCSVELLPCGEIVNKYINQLDNFYDNIQIDRYVIMPNHIHLMLFVFPLPEVESDTESGTPRTSSPTRKVVSVSQFVETLKRFCNKEYGKNIWQRNFHDHIIRNQKDYEEHINYIYYNPVRWHLDELYTDS